MVDELLVASASGEHPFGWPRTRAAWSSLYGGDAPENLFDMLADAAADIRIRMQRSPSLRSLWSALAIGSIGVQVAGVGSRIDALVDPAAAIRFNGPAITKDPARAVGVAAALAEELARGEPGNLIGLEAVGDGSVRIHPRPGVPLEFQVTKKVPDTPEGRAELDRMNAALTAGEPFDFGEVTIEARLGGRAVRLLPETGILKTGPARRKVQAMLSVASPAAGIDERIVLRCDATRAGDTLRMVARSSNRGLLRADITLHAPTRRATFTFRLADEGDLRLADQLLLHRVFAAFASGGAIEMYLVEYNINSRTEFGPEAAFNDGAAALPGLELLAEVGRLLGVEPEPLESFSDQDVALLGWARQLLTAGEAPMVVAGDSLTLRGTDETWADLLSRADSEGRLSISWPQDSYPIEIDGQTLELGPVWHAVQGARLPHAPTQDGDGTVVVISWDSSATHAVVRPLPSEAHPDDSTPADAGVAREGDDT